MYSLSIPIIINNTKIHFIIKLATQIKLICIYERTNSLYLIITILFKCLNLFSGNIKEQRLTTNIVKSVITKLQELSVLFRGTQNNYIKQIKSREERSKMYFDDSAIKTDFDMFENNDTIDDYFVNNKQMSQQQLLYLEEENTVIASQREQEVNSIVKSIVDLNDIFKELAQMVADQGTILDRIDYNIEQTQTQVYEGFKQLQKADNYQRKNRKMCCIIILAATTVLLIILLIIFKT